MLHRDSILARRSAILDIARRHGAYDLKLIGSVAAGSATDASDIDFTARFEPDRSLLDHGALVMDLQDLLGTQVDVIDEDAMKPRFLTHALAGAIPL